MGVGRPTLYEGEETIKKSLEYIESCVDVFSGQVKKVKLPKAEGLAIHLGVSRDTLYAWARDYRAFSDILELINKLQIEKVFNEALAGNYNATIAKLLLAKHGYKEETKHEHEGNINLTQILTKADEHHPAG